MLANAIAGKNQFGIKFNINILLKTYLARAYLKGFSAKAA